MTITLAWWWVPLALLVTGIAVPCVWFGKQQGDYDFVTPLIGLAIFLGCAGAALAFSVGHWVCA